MRRTCRYHLRSTTRVAAVAALAAIPAPWAAAAGNGPGAVYTMSNAANGNEILTFHRAANGMLTPDGGLGRRHDLGADGLRLSRPDALRLRLCVIQR